MKLNEIGRTIAHYDTLANKGEVRGRATRLINAAVRSKQLTDLTKESVIKWIKTHYDQVDPETIKMAEKILDDETPQDS